MNVLLLAHPYRVSCYFHLLLFIKSWQLSHNFTYRLVEKLSADFTALFLVVYTQLLLKKKKWSMRVVVVVGVAEG